MLGIYSREGGGNAGWITDDSCWCQSVQISYGVRLGKSTFYLEKKSHLKKVSWFFFFTLSLLLYLKCAPLSFYFIFFQISTSFFFLFFFRSPCSFTRSRLPRLRLRTPGLLHQYPWGQCPRWADERSSAIYIRSLSCPTVPCVSVQRGEKNTIAINWPTTFSKIAETVMSQWLHTE